MTGISLSFNYGNPFLGFPAAQSSFSYQSYNSGGYQYNSYSSFPPGLSASFNQLDQMAGPQFASPYAPQFGQGRPPQFGGPMPPPPPPPPQQMGQQGGQNPLQMIMQMFMQFMQMMMQMLGMNPQQNGGQGQQFGGFPGQGGGYPGQIGNGNASAYAAASAGNGNASAYAAASAGQTANASAYASASASGGQGQATQQQSSGGLGKLLGPLLGIGLIGLVARFPGLGMSPLTLDTNKDGKVSAEKGKGVDIDGDGKADGAATGGDKMMAMGDIDGDGKITGKEVFGNKTVDPFTGKDLNAANGFDAMNQIAQSAEQRTGIKCTDDNGNVDLYKLRQAIQQGTGGKGSLGYISDDNVSNLESLESQDAVSLNTRNYTNQQDTGSVQHNQLGNYTDSSGRQQKVDDIWFV